MVGETRGGLGDSEQYGKLGLLWITWKASSMLQVIQCGGEDPKYYWRRGMLRVAWRDVGDSECFGKSRMLQETRNTVEDSEC